MTRAPIAVIAALCLASPALAQPAHPRVGVIVDLAANVSDERATELGSALADALQRELDVDAIGGADVARRLPPAGVPDECVAEPRCVAELAARLDASELLFLAIVQVGTTVQVDATWASVATGQVVARPRVELPADARAGEVFAAAAKRLLPDAAPREAIVTTAPVVVGPSRHLTRGTWIAGGLGIAALAAGTGFGLSARGTYDRCERDPDTCDAGTRSGITTRARVADAMFIGAIAGIATAAILYLRSDRESAPAKAQAWRVAPTRHGAMAEFRVEF
ncbi:MAG: hypothetical protein K8W52_06050 [Deltaproteobacteria bacterium]|nr:hypothetical protein [Deltaproteobacteria bacterium]